jgi:hypothetical protein
VFRQLGPARLFLSQCAPTAAPGHKGSGDSQLQRRMAYRHSSSCFGSVTLRPHYYGNFLVSYKWAGLVQPPDPSPLTLLNWRITDISI